MTQVDGPWTHREVAANGARFHVAELGTGPLVLLLHGFPEFWWAWRHQLPALADAGYRAVAMDLRGYGGSDKTPRGYDPMTLAADVAGVIRTLGVPSAVVVGQGWGGHVGWAAAAGSPGLRVGAVQRRGTASGRARAHAGAGSPRAPRSATSLAMQVPWLPERRIRRPAYVARHLERWSSPLVRVPVLGRGATATRRRSRTGRPRTARWSTTAGWSGRGCAPTVARSARLMRPALDAARPAGRRARTTRRSASPPYAVRRGTSPATGSHQVVAIEAAGHFPHEEQPATFTEPCSVVGQHVRGLRRSTSSTTVVRSDGAVAGVDARGGGAPGGCSVGHLVGGQGVAGVAVGDGGREDHAEHVALTSTSGPPELPCRTSARIE